MRVKWIVAPLLLACSAVVRGAPPRPLHVVLFDFENGVAGWVGNPWGGGKCGVEPADQAKFGAGCLRGWYADVEKGANLICPYFAAEAGWRKFPWGGLSFYLRGDGSGARLVVQLETNEKRHATYSRSVPLEDTGWHRVYLPFHTFWNRGGKKFDPGRMRRFYFGTTGTHHFFVDQIQLEAPHRVVPLTPLPTVAIPEVGTPPRLDGRLDDPCWKRAAEVDPFQVITGEGPAAEPTRCLLVWSGHRVFVAAELRTAHPERLRATLTRHDSDVWTEDAFELFLADRNPAVRYYQFAVNPRGTTAELSAKEGRAFTHDWQAKTTLGRRGWTVEISLALPPLVAAVKPGVSFGLNLARENRVTGELSCWSPTGHSFLRPDRFGQAVLLGGAPLVPALPTPVWLDYGNGRYAARMDAGALTSPTGARLRAVFRLGDRVFTGTDTASGTELTQRELVAPVAARLDREGEARVLLTLLRGDGRPAWFHAFRYKVFLPLKAGAKRSPLPLVPEPKELTVGSGRFVLPIPFTMRTVGGADLDTRVTGLLTRELKRWYDVPLTPATGGGKPALVLYLRAPGAKTDFTPLPPGSAARLDGLGSEGYVLRITPKQAVLAATGAAGLYYGAQTFLQIVEQTTTNPAVPQARCCTLVDWPSLRWRAVSESLPTVRWGYPNDAPVDVGFFCDYIQRRLARYKFNALVLLVRQGVEFHSHPEISGPAAWTQAELRRVVRTCRDNFIEPIPLVDSYGHAAWLTLSHKELWEDGDHHLMCSSNPKTFKILTDVYSELLHVFAPVHYFHLGLDEVWWKTLDTPPDKRCKRCAGIPKWKLFADQVKRLHDWLKARHVRAMMWSDVLLPEHNGGAPYHGAKALPRIPTDVLQTNWSTPLAPDSNRRLHDLGFEVWQSNSRGVNREQAEYCTGNMFGVWSKMPWWSDTPWRAGGAYSFLNLPIAAQNSWNLWPELTSLQPPLSFAEVRKYEPALCADARAPEPHAGAATFVLDLPMNMSSRASTPPTVDHWFGASPTADLRRLPRGDVVVGDTTFRILAAARDCLAPLPPGKGVVTIPVGRKVAALRFLHCAHLVPDRKQAFLEGFKQAANWRGIPLGAYRMHYTDGTTAACPLLYVTNIKSWRIGDAIPYIFRSVGYLFAATEAMRRQDPNGRDICLYVAQWVNPHPDKTLASLTVTGCAGAVPVLFAVSGRAPR